MTLLANSPNYSFHSLILFLRNGTVVNDDGEEQVDVYIEVINSF